MLTGSDGPVDWLVGRTSHRGGELALQGGQPPLHDGGGHQLSGQGVDLVPGVGSSLQIAVWDC